MSRGCRLVKNISFALSFGVLKINNYIKRLRMADIIKDKDLEKQNVRQKGTGFTNLSRFVDANKNNQLGQAVQQGAQKTVDAVNDRTETAKGLFGQKLSEEQKRSQETAGAATSALNRIAGGQFSQEDEKKATSGLNNAFAGPKDLSSVANVANIRAQALDAKNLGRDALTQEGRQGLLQRFVGGNRQYNQAQQRFDTGLLAPTAKPALSAVRRIAGQAENNLQTAVGDTQGQAAALAGNINQGVNDLKTQLQTRTSEIESPATTRLQQQTANKTTFNQQASNFEGAINDAVNTGDLNKVLAAAQNKQGTALESAAIAVNNIVNNGKAAGLSNSDILNLIRSNTKVELRQTADDLGSVLNEQQANSLNALNRLTGKTTNFKSTQGSGGNVDVKNVTAQDADRIFQSNVQSAADKFAKENAGADLGGMRFSEAQIKQGLAPILRYAKRYALEQGMTYDNAVAELWKEGKYWRDTLEREGREAENRAKYGEIEGNILNDIAKQGLF